MALASIDVSGMQTLVRGLEHSLDVLDDARSGLRSTLQSLQLSSGTSRLLNARAWAEGQLPQARRRLALAESLEGTHPGWPVGVVQFDDEKDISSVDPATAAKNGMAAAQALMDADGIPSDELIQQIVDGQADPYFASAFAGQLSPEDLAELMGGWSRRRVQPGSSYTYEEAQAKNAWYARLVNGISTTLGTGTRATGDLALPADYAQSWVKAITAEPPGVYGADEDASGRTDQAAALSVLLSAGTFSDSFATTVATGVYDYERAWSQENPGKVWEPRASQIPYGIVDVNGNYVRDPMPGILQMLGHNAEAAQNFFDGGSTTTVTIDGTQVQVSERLHYLVIDRTWANDPDDGAGLGAALQAATTQIRDLSYRGQISADLAGQTLALIGEETGKGKDWWHFQDPGWQMGDGLRSPVAAILQSYAADLYRVGLHGSDDLAAGFSGSGSGDDFGTPTAYGTRLDQELVAKILAKLGEDDDDFSTVLAGLFQAGDAALDHGLTEAAAQQQGPLGALILAGKPVDHVTSTVNNTSTVLSWALGAGFQGASDDKERRAEQAAAIADALSLASSLPFIPDIKNEWLSLAVDQGKSATIDAIRDSISADPEGAYDQLSDQAVVTLTDNTLNQLLRHGVWDADSLAAASEQEGLTITPPPETAIVRDAQGRPVRFDTTSTNYRHWVVDSGLSAEVQQQVLLPIINTWAGPR